MFQALLVHMTLELYSQEWEKKAPILLLQHPPKDNGFDNNSSLKIYDYKEQDLETCQ